MKIRFNEKSEITEFAIVGSLPDSLEIDDSLKPEGFENTFKSGYYLYQDNKIVTNQDYEEPTVSIPENPEISGPSKEWQAINMLALQVAQLKIEKGGV